MNISHLHVFPYSERASTPAARMPQVPLEVSRYRGTNLALRWLIAAAKARAGRTISIKLASEIIDASNKVGNAMRKREETHRMAEANKAFAHFRY